jgi:hypothetical protein
MNPEERDQFTEQLLDATLRRYSTAEPAPGLEERLLSKLAATPVTPRLVSHRWPWMLAAAAALLIAVLATATLWQRSVPVVSKGSIGQSSPSGSVNELRPEVSNLQPPTATELPLSVTHQRPTAVRTAAPHREHFPISTPPSQQERLLLSFVDRTPVPELLATNARLAAERDADLKRFFADADPANPAGDAQ